MRKLTDAVIGVYVVARKYTHSDRFPTPRTVRTGKRHAPADAQPVCTVGPAVGGRDRGQGDSRTAVPSSTMSRTNVFVVTLLAALSFDMLVDAQTVYRLVGTQLEAHLCFWEKLETWFAHCGGVG